MGRGNGLELHTLERLHSKSAVGALRVQGAPEGRHDMLQDQCHILKNGRVEHILDLMERKWFLLSASCSTKKTGPCRAVHAKSKTKKPTMKNYCLLYPRSFAPNLSLILVILVANKNMDHHCSPALQSGNGHCNCGPI